MANNLEKLKENYKKFKFAVEMFDRLEKPSYSKVAKITNLDYNSVVRYLDDWESYQVVYGIEAKKKYDTIQEKVKEMNEEKEAIKDNDIIAEAKEFLESNLTVDEFTEKKNISNWTLQSHFRQLQVTDPKLYESVKEHKEKIKLDRFNNQIISEAKFYLEHNYTISKTEEELGLGKRVLYEHFKKLETIDPKLYAIVKEKQENSYPNQIIEEAKDFLKSNLSYDDFVNEKGLNKRTLSSRFMRLKDIDLELYDLVKEKQNEINLAKDEDYINDIIETAYYYLEHNYTVAKLAELKHINKSTLSRRFEKLKDINPELYDLIREKQDLSTPYSQEEIDNIANIFITNQCTLDELSKATSRSKSSLYRLLKSDNIAKDKKDKIDAIFEANCHHTSIKEDKTF